MKDKDKLYQEIADYMLGTCNSTSSAEQMFNVSEDIVLEACTEHEVELCDDCGWWCELHELDDGEEGTLVCIDCL